MQEPKVFLAANLRLLRQRKKLSQQELANVLNLTRSKINALERGHIKAPPPEDFINIAGYFNISVDNLVKIDLTAMSEQAVKQLESGNDGFTTGRNLRILHISTDSDNRENIAYVPVKAKAGYPTGFNDPEYIAGLPKFNFPVLPDGKTFRMFPTEGDSMLPIPEGSDIIAFYVQDWRSLKPATLGIVALHGDQELVFKQITIEGDEVLLESLNTAYEPYKVKLSDVLEIWQYYSFHSRIVPKKASDLGEISKSLSDLKRDVKAIQSKLDNG
ncbi:XRE family transcriptional regulator [Pedobacter jeongneungensis]|uniref:XRE family transcriptional regulator n=1 Tax=Pedobacter jeongneungensis TaxID=947309 RepID=UPI00046A481B|nr:LexA family transcriptional regulator [Pedobacter jeongneungensis]